MEVAAPDQGDHAEGRRGERAGLRPGAPAPFCVGLRASGDIQESWLTHDDGTRPAALAACPTVRTAGPLVAIREDAPLPLGLGNGLFVADFVRGCAWIASRTVAGESIAVVVRRAGGPAPRVVVVRGRTARALR